MGQITLIETAAFLMLSLRPRMMVRDKIFNIILNTNTIKFEKYVAYGLGFLDGLASLEDLHFAYSLSQII